MMNDEKDIASKSVESPKVWIDLTADEKIERMRDEVKNLQRQLDYRNRDLYSLKRKFHKHMHSPDGKLVSEIQEYDDSGAELQSDNSLRKGIYF